MNNPLSKSGTTATRLDVFDNLPNFLRKGLYIDVTCCCPSLFYNIDFWPLNRIIFSSRIRQMQKRPDGRRIVFFFFSFPECFAVLSVCSCWVVWSFVLGPILFFLVLASTGRTSSTISSEFSPASRPTNAAKCRHLLPDRPLIQLHIRPRNQVEIRP